ncbi:hypothetical protein BT96DRAFT_1003040 [Gymnopus androsaceus JB14]|uniref:Carboxylesterase type B domain-containing protein n=1 Tax=Gymnopus androsaceus JB14 TaxID=1447944 RepID=A0A6A4GUW1_9AGAR|nr:hypothetical protein BT96DRAFT_1003040 [Gymnopus androsaceus JB14]
MGARELPALLVGIKVTRFGESTGAVTTAVQLLNPSISNSGSAASPLTYGPLHRQVDWDNFVAGVPGYEKLSSTDNKFECLRSADTTAIFNGLVIAQNEFTEQFPWCPIIDGMGGFMPELPSLLFAKRSLRRYHSSLARICMKG